MPVEMIPELGVRQTPEGYCVMLLQEDGVALRRVSEPMPSMSEALLVQFRCENILALYAGTRERPAHGAWPL